MDICFAVPPFHTLHYPPLGAPILKRACEARGFSACVVYGGIPLAVEAGFDAYDLVCRAIRYPKIGERLFRPYAYPPETVARLPAPEPLSAAEQAVFDGVAGAIAPALDAFVAQVLASQPRILGISSMFEQNLAASALAWRVKAAAPAICIVMGGANTAWPMARGLADVFPWVDHFFSGESDVDFVEFCERLIRHGERPAQRIICSEPIRDMRVVHAPDFSDFFAALRPLQEAGRLPGWLPRWVTMETSRGCWWGAKQHCTFCGLNGDGMDFREKPAGRALDELADLSRWQVDCIRMADNIMPRQYLKDLLPALARTEPRLRLFYEVKANLTEDQVDVMALGGVTKIQPGIESLSSHVLRLMRKGVSAHQNIALLRSCAGVGLSVVWNIIYGFPGETADDYEATIALLPRLEHLQPPQSTHEIHIDRFSPFFREPETLGIGPIAPAGSYRALYPPEAALHDIAYHFSAEYSTELLGNPGLRRRLHAAVTEWEDGWDKDPRPVLQLFAAGASTLILDTRRIARQPVTALTAERLAALRHCDTARARSGLTPALADAADWLLARDFLIEHEGSLLSVVVCPRADIAAVVGRSSPDASAGVRASA